MKRVVMYDDVIQIFSDAPLKMGDKLPVFRGSGPRDGARMATATVVGVDENGEFLFDVGPVEPGDPE